MNNESHDDQSTAPISTWRMLRNRVIAGIFVVLPVFITYFVIRWLYDTAYTLAIGPIALGLRRVWGNSDAEPSLALNVVSSIAAIMVVLSVLYIAGMFFRSRIHRAVDWVLLNVPGVNTVYSSVSNVFNALSNSHGKQNFKRVVLIEFPHPGMKAPAFVTSECIEETTGKVILCVYVPTTPVPTSGYMLLVPEEKVVALNWDLEETLQAIVSGGITVPPRVTYQSVDSIS
jgi:uncharacterized membrane protein